MQFAKNSSTPMTNGLKLSTYESDPVEKKHSWSLTICNHSRLEISYCINRVCQFIQNPLESHQKLVKKILRYLGGTLDYSLHLRRSSQLNLVGLCDADWATDPDDRSSTSSYCVFLGANLVSWYSKKQHTISHLSTEAKYRSLANIVAELTQITSLLDEVRVSITKRPIVWCNNLSTLQLVANPVLHDRTKHVELDLYFVREKVLQKKVMIQHVPSIDQTEDVLTKPISSSKFPLLRNKLKVEDLATLSLRGGC